MTVTNGEFRVSTNPGENRIRASLAGYAPTEITRAVLIHQLTFANVALAR